MRSHTEDSGQISLPGMEEDSGNNERIESVFNLTSADIERVKRRKPKTLGIVCSRSECKGDLHCFRPVFTDEPKPPGGCQKCGLNLVNWEQMHAREPLDASSKFDQLKREWIRHFFFHLPLTPRIELYARKHGTKGLVEVARRQLSRNQMLTFNKTVDFKQTTMLPGTIIHWARHAVACCCRRCMAYWHNVPIAATLSPADIEYFEQLIMLYVKERMPDLPNFGGRWTSEERNEITPDADSKP